MKIRELLSGLRLNEDGQSSGIAPRNYAGFNGPQAPPASIQAGGPAAIQQWQNQMAAVGRQPSPGVSAARAPTSPSTIRSPSASSRPALNFPQVGQHSLDAPTGTPALRPQAITGAMNSPQASPAQTSAMASTPQPRPQPSAASPSGRQLPFKNPENPGNPFQPGSYVPGTNNIPYGPNTASAYAPLQYQPISGRGPGTMDTLAAHESKDWRMTLNDYLLLG
jgi:hypothetical protein